MRSDRNFNGLIIYGYQSPLPVRENLWHAYILYQSLMSTRNQSNYIFKCQRATIILYRGIILIVFRLDDRYILINSLCDQVPLGLKGWLKSYSSAISSRLYHNRTINEGLPSGGRLGMYVCIYVCMSLIGLTNGNGRIATSWEEVRQPPTTTSKIQKHELGHNSSLVTEDSEVTAASQAPYPSSSPFIFPFQRRLFRAGTKCARVFFSSCNSKVDSLLIVICTPQVVTTANTCLKTNIDRSSEESKEKVMQSW